MFPESTNSFPPYHSKTKMKNMLVMGDDSSVSDGKNGYCPAVRQLQTDALRTDNQCTIHCKIFQNLPCTNAHGSFQSLGHAVFSNDMPLLQPTWDHCHTTEDEFDSWCSQSPTKHHEDSRQVLYLSQPPVDKQNYLT